MKDIHLKLSPLIKYCIVILLLLGLPILGYAQKKKDIKTIEVSTKDFSDLSPGNQIIVGAKVITHGGKEKSTKTVYGGKMGWNKFNVHVTGGTFSNGILTVESDLLKIRDHVVMLVISDTKNEKTSVTKTFKLNFKSPQTCRTNGKTGDEGKDGEDGLDGKKTDIQNISDMIIMNTFTR